MPGSFEMDLTGYAKSGVWGQVHKGVEVRSIGGYKGTIRIDYSLQNVPNGSTTPAFGWVFLDEDEIHNGTVTVSGESTTTGILTAVATDGADTVTKSTGVII